MIFDYILAWLITFGIAWTLASSDGPFGMYLRFRNKVRKRYGEGSIADNGVNCPICVGFWVAIPVAFFCDGGVSMWLSAAGFVTLAMVLSPD